VVEKEDCTTLYGKFGIFESRRDVLEKIKNGELSGLSISASYGNVDYNEGANSDHELTLTIDPSHRAVVGRILRSHGIRYRARIQKSASALAAFDIIANNLDTIVTALVVYLQWHENSSDEGSEPVVDISGDNNSVSIGGMTEEELRETISNEVDELEADAER